MKQSIRIFLSTYFIFIALLYLAMRYTTFSMNPVLYGGIVSLLIVIVVTLRIRDQIAVDIFTVSIVILSILMLLSLSI